MAGAEALSIIGDQLSRVALALLVFGRTGSATLSGLTYALTFLPTVVGGLLLSSQVDRRPRRELLIAINALRAILVLAMAVPGMPLAVLCTLVAASAFLIGPYNAANLSLLRDVLPQEQYGAGMSLRQSLSQAGQLVGFASGGFLATTLSPASCLLIDSATFALCALVIRLFVQRRPAALSKSDPAATATTNLSVVWGTPARRVIFLSTFAGVFLTAPEALAAPLVSEHGLGSQWVGIFMASGGLCSVAGLAIFGRLTASEQYARVFPVAFLAPGLLLLPIGWLHNPIVLLLLIGVSGAAWSVLTVIAVTSFAGLLSDAERGRGMGVAGSVNLTSQGVGAALAGVLADQLSSSVAIALLGAAATLFALRPATQWRRLAPAAPASEELAAQRS